MSSSEEDRREDVFARLQELRACESEAKRKRREDLLGRAQLRVEQRARSVSLVSSVHLDLSEVHSKISGPKLTWDFDNAHPCDLEIDADRFGGSGSRTALEHHIKQRLSQASAKVLARQIQQAPPPPPLSSEHSHSLASTEKMSEHASADSNASEDEEDLFLSMPELIPLEEEEEVPLPLPLQLPLQLPSPPSPPRFPFAGFSQNPEPTQLVESPRSDATAPADEEEDERTDMQQRRVLNGPLMSDSNLVFPASSLFSQRVLSDKEFKDERKAAKEERRKARKERLKEIRKELRGYVEEAAEESDDEEFTTYRGRNKKGEEEEESSEEEGDLEELVASAEEEAKIARRAKKDKRKLAKLHEEWAEKKDKELEERAEKGEFRKRRKMEALLGEEGEEMMSRRERLRRTKYDSNGERILSSEEESSEEEEEEWLSEEEEEWKEKAKKKKEIIKKITDRKILQQKNLNSLGVNVADKGEYENSVQEVSVFGVDKKTEPPVFAFLAGGTKKIGFR